MVLTFDINKSLSQVKGNIIFTTKDQLDIEKFITFKDYIDGESSISRLSREFATSTDNKEWTIWQKLSDEILSTELPLNQKFYFKIRYTIVEKYDENPVIINSFELIVDAKEPVQVGKEKVLSFKNADNLDFYKMGEQFVEMHNDMNNYLNRGYGIPVRYFKTNPDLSSIDPFLGEYSLRNVINKDGTMLKIVIPENMIPEPKHEFNEFGIAFDSFEIHISKDYYEETFGIGAKPSNKDFFYFKAANRMYYISSNYLGRGIQESANYYVATLKTYEDDSSVIKPPETQNFIDENTQSMDTLFKDQIQNEISDSINDKQDSLKTVANDAVRSLVNEQVIIVDDVLHNNGSLLLRSYYNFVAVPGDEYAVTYSNGHNLINGSWSTGLWINIQDPIVNAMTINIVGQDRIDFNRVRLTFDKAVSNIGLNDYDAICRLNDFYDIIEIVDDIHIIIKSRVNIPEEKYDNYGNANKINLHKTIESAIYFSIDIYNENVLRIRYNNIITDFVNLSMARNKWYSVVVNISHANNYVGVYIYDMITRGVGNQDMASTRLNQVFKREIPININNRFVIPEDSIPSIAGSNCFMSNIRIFKQAIDEEHQSYVMGTKSIKKPSLAFIIDDADVIFNTGIVGRGYTYTRERSRRKNDFLK